MSSLNISFRRREDSRGSLKLDEERSIFGKIYDSVKEKKKSLDLSPSIHKIEEMFRHEEAKIKQTQAPTTPRGEKNEASAPLNMSALRLLDAIYNQEDRLNNSAQVPARSNNPYANVDNPRTLQRKDSLRSLPTYHSSEKAPAVKHKETSHRGLPFKRDNSMIDVIDDEKRSHRSIGRSKRSMSSPKNAEVTRKHMEKLTRFEHTRKVNLEKLQSKLSASSAPIVVSSRLPSSLLPPLSLRGTAKAEMSRPAERAISPTLMPRSPRSPIKERPAPSLASSSASVNEKDNNNIDNTNHAQRIDTSKNNIAASSTNLQRSANININNPTITVTLTDTSTPDKRWFRPIAGSPDTDFDKASFTISQRSYKSRSYDGRQLITRELSVASHRLVKDDSDL